MVISNSTSALNSIQMSNSAVGWLVFVAVAVLTVVVLFVLSKNFRRFIYGLCVVVPLAAISWFSSSIAKPASEGNFKPLIITLMVFVSIGVSIVIGLIVERTKLGKKIGEILESKE